MTPRVVLDTNVLVAGLLNPYGTCAAVLRLLVGGKFHLAADARILIEYHDVLARPRLGFDRVKAGNLLDYVRSAAEIHAPPPWPHALPDPDDAPFLEVARAAQADGLVTGNLRHFPIRARHGGTVRTPGEFLEWIGPEAGTGGP